MRVATSVIVTIAGLTGLAYMVRAILPSSPVFTVEWNAQQFFIPFNIAACWACAMTGVFLGVFQTVRAMLRDAERMR